MDLVTPAKGEISSVASLQTSANRFLAAAKAENTVRAYKADWRQFHGWCETQDRSALPASTETVVLFLTFLAEAGLKISTIRRHVATIRLTLSSPTPLPWKPKKIFWMMRFKR